MEAPFGTQENTEIANGLCGFQGGFLQEKSREAPLGCEGLDILRLD